MFKSILLCGAFLISVVFGQDGAVTTTPAPIQVEREKLASKDWRHYRGCEDTCFSLCLEKPKEFDSKCSTLFSNNTLVNAPLADSCKSAETIQGCTYQCLCACKRCAFCKQDLVNACAEDTHPVECFDNVLEDILNKSKCD